LIQTSIALLVALTVCLGLQGCIPKPNPTTQAPVTVNVELPPTPPSSQDLEKPPAVNLEKPERDPFIALAGEGGATSGKEGESAGAPGEGGGMGGMILSGVMSGGTRSSAIVESGGSTYIVHPGDPLGPYRVSAITGHSVVLVKGKEKVVLTLAK